MLFIDQNFFIKNRAYISMPEAYADNSAVTIYSQHQR